MKEGSKTVHETIADDPFIRSINTLTFQGDSTGNPDVDVLRAIIDDYVTEGRYADAARTGQLIGDCACLETSTVRERYNRNPLPYGTRLAELLELAGTVLRAGLVRNMLSKMETPEGQCL